MAAWGLATNERHAGAIATHGGNRTVLRLVAGWAIGAMAPRGIVDTEQLAVLTTALKDVCLIARIKLHSREDDDAAQLLGNLDFEPRLTGYVKFGIVQDRAKPMLICPNTKPQPADTPV